ncbi:MAG: CDP-glucose 4,6-dehydratase [Ilumatobacteraceae bacterium]
MANLVDALATFAGKRVLITGDTGFKGSWLSLWLHQQGATVYGYALPPEGPNSHFSLLKLETLIEHEDGDIRDMEHLHTYFEDVQPQFVFHLAAQALVRRSYREPKETFDTNVGGSINVLECVRLTSSVQSLVYITSDKCYRNREIDIGYSEDDELGGHDPYSASKAGAEMAFAAYNESFFKNRPNFGAASARAGNVIGGGDWSEDRIIPDCIRALKSNEPIVLRHPDATRPWQHVLEPLSGYITLADRLIRDPEMASGSWNFGPPESAVHSVEDLARECIKVWGSGTVSVEPDSEQLHEATLLKLNCAKARKLLQWSPRWDWATTIGEAVSWYRSVIDGQSVTEIGSAQLKKYEETTNG